MDHLELVRRQYDAFAARDWDALAELWHPEIVYRTFESGTDPGTYRGLEEATRFFDSWGETFPEFRVELAETIEVGNRVVAVERQSGRGIRGSASETWLEQTFACLIDFKDGRIWRVREYRTLDEAVEAASPQDP
jgi:ketosteroid isomerase-like protein